MKFLFGLPWIISFIFLLIPFLWLAPGEMDLGGDSSRFYFYDPLQYLFSQGLYSVSNAGFGGENFSFFGIPFFLILIFLKSIIQPTILISLFHGFSLSVAFLSCYLIVKELLLEGKEVTLRERTIVESAAILGGLFYNLSPVPILEWNHVILTFNQVFLNPLVFYLLLRFFLKADMRFLLGALLISLIFAPNFSFIAAPPFFAFYPVAVLFLILYSIFVRKRILPVKGIILGIVLFLLLHAFHLVPRFTSIFSSGSVEHATIFSQEAIVDRGLGYFTAIAPGIKTSINLLRLPQMTSVNPFSWLFIVLPAFLIMGFVWNKKKGYLLTGIFFLIVLFFASANITKIGFTFYISLFQIPGFSMFRNFYGQWQWAFHFFYMLLLGQGLAIVLSRLNKKWHRYILVSFVGLLLLSTSWPFISGKLTDSNLWQSNNIKSHFRMDTDYEKVLSYIRLLPVDGKILTLPMSDHAYQIVQGKDGGAYMGPSTITYLTNKNEFVGFGELGTFSQKFLNAVRDKDYNAVKNMLSVFNIKYIFYNSDPFIYGDNFPAFPYMYVYKFLPPTQAEYKNFIENLGLEKIADFGEKYHIYGVKEVDYLPHIYAAKESYYVDVSGSDVLLPLQFNPKEKRIAITDKEFKKIDNFDNFDEIFLLAKNKSLYIDAAKKKNYQPADNPAIAERLSPLLPFITGLIQRNKSDQIDDAYIDNATKKAESIIDEAKNKGDQLSLILTPNVVENLNREQNELGQLFSRDSLIENSWNMILFRYVTEMSDVIDKIKKTNNSSYSMLVNKNSLNDTLNLDEINISQIISSLIIKSAKDKIFLGLLTNKTFDYLKNQLDLNLGVILQADYSVDIPKEAIYEVYWLKGGFDDPEPTTASLTLADKKLQQYIEQPEEYWLRFDDVSMETKKDVLIKIPLVTKNIINKEESWQTLDGHSISTNTSTFKLNDQVGDSIGGQLGGLFRQIEPFKPEALYEISLDYRTSGKNFWINIVEVVGKVNKLANFTKGDTLRSNDWKTYRIVVRAGDDPNTIFLIQIMPRESCFPNCSVIKNLDKIEIKNISVNQIFHPEIILRANNYKSGEEKNIPQINFIRINPTKYEIKIANATNPYTLVFLGDYNNNWKLYDANSVNNRTAGILSSVANKVASVFEKEREKEVVIASYFDGEVVEGKHSNTFMNPDIFETWGKQAVADNKHFEVNGYANGWNIEPYDVGGKADYTLILESTSQQIFYRFFLVSLISFTVTTVLFLKVIWRE